MIVREVTMLGEYVRRLRKSRGWTQEQLAERANVDQTFVSQVETNKTRPSFEYMKRLADGLAVPVDELLGAAGLLDEPRESNDGSEMGQLIAYVEHDPELRAQLAEIRATEAPEVYDRVVRELVELWKTQLRLLLQLRPRA